MMHLKLTSRTLYTRTQKVSGTSIAAVYLDKDT